MKFLGFFVGAILALSVTGASAKTVKIDDQKKDKPNQTQEVNNVPPPPAPCSIAYVTTSTDCVRIAGNNDKAVDLNSFNSNLGAFGVTNWFEADKDEDGSALVAPYNLTGFVDGAKSGTWSVASFGGWSSAALVVKGGSVGFVAYLLDLTKLSGTWNTNDLLNKGGNIPGLSHLTLYVGGSQVLPPPPPPPPVTTVPLPAGGVLLLGGLGALAALRRRKAN